jgi:hypothetical protein
LALLSALFCGALPVSAWSASLLTIPPQLGSILVQLVKRFRKLAGLKLLVNHRSEVELRDRHGRWSANIRQYVDYY